MIRLLMNIVKRSIELYVNETSQERQVDKSDLFVFAIRHNLNVFSGKSMRSKTILNFFFHLWIETEYLHNLFKSKRQLTCAEVSSERVIKKSLNNSTLRQHFNFFGPFDARSGLHYANYRRARLMGSKMWQFQMF